MTVFRLHCYIGPNGRVARGDSFDPTGLVMLTFSQVVQGRPSNYRYAILQPEGSDEIWVVDLFECAIGGGGTQISIGDHRVYSNLDAAIADAVTTY